MTRTVEKGIAAIDLSSESYTTLANIDKPITANSVPISFCVIVLRFSSEACLRAVSASRFTNSSY